MSEIVPRWEWRTFGERFGGAEERLTAMEPERVQDSRELYVLALDSDASIKARDGVIDVKRLERVDDDGLEQWLPVAKATYPVAADEIRRLVEALGAPMPALSREEYTLEQLVDEVIIPNPELLAVVVHKHREHFRVDGCMTELSEMRTDFGTTRTIAVESEDPAVVVSTVRDLGLPLAPNVSLARELKRLAGFDAHRFAAIDVGTNSVKLHVGERRADGTWRTIADRAQVTRLGEGQEVDGRLQRAPIARTVEAISLLADEARRDGAEQIAAVGTAGLRRARNRAVLIDAVRTRTNVKVDVISGEEEARLAYVAATSSLGLGGGAGSLVVFDTGGGSSQFSFGDGERIDERFSVEVGAARFTEGFGLDGPVDREVLRAALAAIAADLGRLDDRQTPDALVGMGGAVTNLTAVKLGLATYDAEAVQGTVLDREEVDRQIELYRRHTAEERREIVGLQPARAEVILAGACIVRTVLEKLGREALMVSDRGLRHGVLADRFSS